MNTETMAALSRAGHLIVPCLGEDTIPTRPEVQPFYLDLRDGEPALTPQGFSLVPLKVGPGRSSAVLTYFVAEGTEVNGQVLEQDTKYLARFTGIYDPRRPTTTFRLLGKDGAAVPGGTHPAPTDALLKLGSKYALFLAQVGFVKGEIAATHTETPTSKHLMERSISSTADAWQAGLKMDSMVALLPGRETDGNQVRVWCAPGYGVMAHQAGTWRPDRFVPAAGSK